MSFKEFPKMLYKSAPGKDQPDSTIVHDEDGEAAARAVGYADFRDLPDAETGVYRNDPIPQAEEAEQPARRRSNSAK